MKSEHHNPGVRLIVRLGNHGRKITMTIPNYTGPLYIGQKFMDALAAELFRRYKHDATKSFSSFEILGHENMEYGS